MKCRAVVDLESARNAGLTFAGSLGRTPMVELRSCRFRRLNGRFMSQPN